MKLKKVSVFVLAMFMLLVSGCNFAPIVNTPVDIEPLDTPEPIIMPTETPTIEPTLEPAPEPTPEERIAALEQDNAELREAMEALLSGVTA